jgi:hypothetical protein
MSLVRLMRVKVGRLLVGLELPVVREDIIEFMERFLHFLVAHDALIWWRRLPVVVEHQGIAVSVDQRTNRVVRLRHAEPTRWWQRFVVD